MGEERGGLRLTGITKPQLKGLFKHACGAENEL